MVNKYDYARLFNLVLKRKTGDSSKDRVLCSHAIFEAFSTANPEFSIAISEKDYLDLNKTGTFSIDDFHRIALLMPDKFNLITSLAPTPEDTIKAQHTISEIEGSASFLEKYGIIYLTNAIIFLHKNADIINYLLTTIELLHQIQAAKKGESKSLFKIISNYVELTLVMGDIQENGITQMNRKRLMTSLLNILIVNPTSRRLKALKRLTKKVMNIAII